MATMPQGKKKVRRQHSAGGAVLAFRDGEVQIAMIATRGKTRWGLPKGALSPEETSQDAAVREVREETNLEAEVISLVKTIEYFFRAGDTLVQKNVDFYLMRYLDGDLKPQLEEVDDVAWVPLREAVTRASFDSERELLGMVQQLWATLSSEEQGRFRPVN